MNEKQYNEQITEEEIDLRELFMVLWKKKVTIICITLIAAIITGLISVFLITPVYHSRLRIIINMPETYHTKYGDYTLPITSNEQYINLITTNEILLHTIEDMEYDVETNIESIRERITIEPSDAKANTIQNTFFVKVAADNPIEAQKLAQTLFDNYVEFLDVLIIEGALDYHINRINVSLQSSEVSLTSTKEILAKNEALLAQTPQTINQKEAMQEVGDSSSTTDYIILENIINPNYTKIESDIIANKQSINSIENSMRINNEYMAELDELKSKVNSYKESGDYSKLDTDFVKVTKTNIYLPSDPIVPSSKTSPSNARNVIIGALLGGMVAVFVVLIKEYWFKPDEEKKSK
jgi:capsular polysaccharide biosynthesis protein